MMLKNEKDIVSTEKKWQEVERIKIQNAPDNLDEIVNLIIKNNPSLHNIIYESDQTDENKKRLIASYNKLVAGIRSFEEGLLYL